jgi:hypothetical protein
VLLSELLPISGAQNADTVRNRTLRVGENVVRQHTIETAKQAATLPAAPVVVGLDGGYVRSRHRQEEHHFEVIAGKPLSNATVRGLERVKWRLWHGRWTGCRSKLEALSRWTKRKHVRDVAGLDRIQPHVSELFGYLRRNQATLAHYVARRRSAEPISTAFVESAVNEIIATRMNKKADALEQDDSAVLPRRTHRRAERQPREGLQPSLSGLPAHQ